MQVILLEKVVNLGDLGDVVRVRNGYARNFLIPNKMARRATADAIAEFETRRAELEKIQAERLVAAEKMATKMADLRVEINQKAGVDGRLFGSVTSMDIAAALAAQGFEEIVKSQVRLPEGPFKAVGEYPVQISLHPDVTSEVLVVVIGDLA